MLTILSQAEGLNELIKDWRSLALTLLTGGNNVIGLFSGFWPRVALSQVGGMWLLVPQR
jgi:hypothetical protein